MGCCLGYIRYHLENMKRYSLFLCCVLSTDVRHILVVVAQCKMLLVNSTQQSLLEDSQLGLCIHNLPHACVVYGIVDKTIALHPLGDTNTPVHPPINLYILYLQGGLA